MKKRLDHWCYTISRLILKTVEVALTTFCCADEEIIWRLSDEMKGVLVTRPLLSALRTGTSLEKMGFKPYLHPLLRIEPIPVPHLSTKLQSQQNLLFSSQNAIRLTASHIINRIANPLKAYVVGEASISHVGHTSGLEVLNYFDSASNMLAHILALGNTGDSYLYLTGRPQHLDIVDELRQNGFKNAEQVVLYNTVKQVTEFEKLAHTIEMGELHYVLFYSQRSVQIFVEALRSARSYCKDLTAVCISCNVAEALADGTFAQVLVAREPNESRMLQLLR